MTSCFCRGDSERSNFRRNLCCWSEKFWYYIQPLTGNRRVRCFTRKKLSNPINIPEIIPLPILPCPYGVRSKLASLRSRRRQYPKEDQYSAASVYFTGSQVQGLPHGSASCPNLLSFPHPSQTVPPSHSSFEPETMACRDRTAEFTSVVKSLQSYHVSQAKSTLYLRPGSQSFDHPKLPVIIRQCCYVKLTVTLWLKGVSLP